MSSETKDNALAPNIVSTFSSSDIYADFENLDLRNRQDPTGGPDHLILKAKIFGLYDKEKTIIPGLKLYYLRSDDASPEIDTKDHSVWEKFGESVIHPTSLNTFAIAHDGASGELQYVINKENLYSCDHHRVKKFLKEAKNTFAYFPSCTDKDFLFSKLMKTYLSKNDMFDSRRILYMIYADIWEFLTQSWCFCSDGEQCPEVFDRVTILRPRDLVESISEGWNLSMIDGILPLNIPSQGFAKNYLDMVNDAKKLLNPTFSTYSLYGIFEKERGR